MYEPEECSAVSEVKRHKCYEHAWHIGCVWLHSRLSIVVPSSCMLNSTPLFMHASSVFVLDLWIHAPSIHSTKHPKVGREGNSRAAFVSYYVLPLNVVRAMHGDVMEYVPKYSTTTILVGGTY